MNEATLFALIDELGTRVEVWVALGLLSAAQVWLVARAFRVHMAWGVACLLFAPASLLFLFLHFQKAFLPFVGSLAAVGLLGWIVGEALQDPRGLWVPLQVSRSLASDERSAFRGYALEKGHPIVALGATLYTTRDAVVPLVALFADWRARRPARSPAASSEDSGGSFVERFLSDPVRDQSGGDAGSAADAIGGLSVP